ncbi:MAG: cytochrome D1 domain-containing protein [Bdellovibrionota bacterium]
MAARGHLLTLALLASSLGACASSVGVGARIYVVQRESESLAVYDAVAGEILPSSIRKLGNMRHATMVFSKDLRWGYLATRNGLLSRINLATGKPAGAVQTSENSIGIAISQDGRYVAVAEYTPGGVTIVDAVSLKILKQIPAVTQVEGKEVRSRTTGLVDTAGNRFVFSLMDGSEIWILDASREDFPVESRFKTAAPNPFDATLTPEGRYYLAGHFESDRISLLDLWHPELGIREVSIHDPRLDFDRAAPIKMPHMEAWAISGDDVYVPLVGEKRLAVLDRRTWVFQRSVPVRGNPVYVTMSPTQRELWVTFSGSEDDRFIEVIDTETSKVTRTIEAGKKIYHLVFSPRGDEVYVSANQDNRFLVFDASSKRLKREFHVESPSGIFGPWRAYQIGF